MAAARCPDIPEDAIIQMVPALEALEAAFQPLLEQLKAAETAE